MPGSRRRRLLVILLAIVFALGLGGFLARDALFFTFVSSGSRADWELMQIRRLVTSGQAEESDESVREKCFELARANPQSRAEVSSLLFVVKQWPETADADVAYTKLQQAAKNADIGDWSRSLHDIRPGDRSQRWLPLAVLLIERVRQQPDHPEAARLLCEVAVAITPETYVESAPSELHQIADLIHKDYATSPNLANFCEVAGNLGSPAGWSRPFESHIRHILEVNQDRFVRLSAHFALASIVRSGGADRQEEARQLYEDFLADFDGETVHPAQSIEQLYRQQSQRALRILQTHGLGMKAPETSGVDLDGNALALKDYRGRVVLVSFWATWCGPCLKAIPHERELLATFGQSDFAIFGINADKDVEKAKAAVQQHGISWRSLSTKGKENSWAVDGYPTFYLLDRNGVIVRSWRGLPPNAKLNEAIGSLVGSKSDKDESGKLQ